MSKPLPAKRRGSVELFKNEFSHVNFCSINPYDMSNIAIVSRTNCAACPLPRIRAGGQSRSPGGVGKDGCGGSSWGEGERGEIFVGRRSGLRVWGRHHPQHPCGGSRGLSPLPLPGTLPELCCVNVVLSKALRR